MEIEGTILVTKGLTTVHLPPEVGEEVLVVGVVGDQVGVLAALRLAQEVLQGLVVHLDANEVDFL